MTRSLPSISDTSMSPGSLYYYYNCKHFRHYKQFYKGIVVGKCLGDLWNYQEVIHGINAGWVLETGTFKGGAACFYADLIASTNPEHGCVVSIDMVPEKRSKKLTDNWPRTHFLEGSSVDKNIVEKAKQLIPFDQENRQPVFVSLDSNHYFKHVLKELETYIPLLKKGDYLVVEDTKYYNLDGPEKAIKIFQQMDIYNRVKYDAPRENKMHGFTSVSQGYFKIIN